MNELADSESNTELTRWSAVALEWLSDENRKFGESLKHLMTYLVAGNIAGVLAIVRIVSEPATRGSVAAPLKVGLCAFSVGALAAIVAALFVVASQWRCLNVYRRRIVELYKGSINIQEFGNAPNYYAWVIGSFQVSAIVAFIVGGTGLFLWVLFL
jgi:hypothetical protein